MDYPAGSWSSRGSLKVGAEGRGSGRFEDGGGEPESMGGTFQPRK